MEQQLFFCRRGFSAFFFDNPMYSSKQEDWSITRKFSTQKVAIGYFTGILESALGWKSEPLDAIMNKDLREAGKALQIGNWKSCIIMSARTVENIVKDVFNTKVLELSLGQGRRLLVAREFTHNMELLFLDEPVVGLDPIVKRVLLDYIRRR